MQFPESSKSQSDEELVLLAKAGDDRAFRQLLLRYCKVIKSIAGKYFVQGTELCDRVQICEVALWQAIRKYNPGKGPFGPFARLIITRKLQSAVTHSNRHKNELFNYTASLDANLYDESNDSLYNFVVEEQSDPAVSVIDSEFKQDFIEFIRTRLSPTEYRITVEMLNHINAKKIDADYRHERVSVYRDIARDLNISTKCIDNAWQRVKKKLKVWYEKRTDIRV
ncbi:MAG: sigma-70 family RNA polymerase sigma factor [Bacillota bacterium]